MQTGALGRRRKPPKEETAGALLPYPARRGMAAKGRFRPSACRPGRAPGVSDIAPFLFRKDMAATGASRPGTAPSSRGAKRRGDPRPPPPFRRRGRHVAGSGPRAAASSTGKISRPRLGDRSPAQGCVPWPLADKRHEDRRQAQAPPMTLEPEGAGARAPRRLRAGRGKGRAVARMSRPWLRACVRSILRGSSRRRGGRRLLRRRSQAVHETFRLRLDLSVAP